MLLYFNGDSFSAGDELADDMLPDYPGLFEWPLDYDSNPMGKKAREWLDNSYDISHPSQKIRADMVLSLVQDQFSRAFPNLVHKQTGLPVINKSRGGDSMDRIARVTITDLVRLKKTNPNNKIVTFITTTFTDRSEVPNTLNEFSTPTNIPTDMHRDPQDWVSISSIFNRLDHDDMFASIRKYKLMYETHYHSLVNFYKNVVLIQDYCALNDIDLFWISGGENIHTAEAVDPLYKNRNDLSSLIEYANMKISISMTDIAEKEMIGQKIMCPGRHYAQPVHDRTAEKIVDILVEKYGVIKTH